MFPTGETVGLAEWIIDDTCLVFRNITKQNKIAVLPLTGSLTIMTLLSYVRDGRS